MLDRIKKKIVDAGYWGDISPNEIDKDIEYLLSIIEQKDAELDKAIAEIKFQVERNDRQREGYFKQEAIVLRAEKVLTYYAEEPYLESIGYTTNAIEALKAIRGN